LARYAAAARIGVMDWGIGGLGFWKLLRQAAPELRCVYLSDAGAPPYGKLPPRQLAQRVARAAAWFEQRGVQRLVVACNAASSVLAQVPRSGAQQGLPLPELLGVIEPTVQALLAGPRCRIGVFGGRRTVRSGAYRTPLAAAGFDVRQRVAQPLSALVEAGRVAGPLVEREVARILTPIAGCEVLVPACTHYVALLPLFEQLAPGARFVDPAELALRALLGERAWRDRAPLPAVRPRAGDEFWTTGSPSSFRRAALRAFQLELTDVKQLRALPCRDG
jgi:glutamate racemase